MQDMKTRFFHNNLLLLYKKDYTKYETMHVDAVHWFSVTFFDFYKVFVKFLYAIL